MVVVFTARRNTDVCSWVFIRPKHLNYCNVHQANEHQVSSSTSDSAETLVLVLVLVLSLLSVTLRSWSKVHFPSSSSQQSHYRTETPDNQLRIPAAVRLINRSQDKSPFYSQKLKSNLRTLLLVSINRTRTKIQLWFLSCVSHQMNREFFFCVLRALTRRPHQLTAADTLICPSGSRRFFRRTQNNPRWSEQSEESLKTRPFNQPFINVRTKYMPQIH